MLSDVQNVHIIVFSSPLAGPPDGGIPIQPGEDAARAGREVVPDHLLSSLTHPLTHTHTLPLAQPSCTVTAYYTCHSIH